MNLRQKEIKDQPSWIYEYKKEHKSLLNLQAFPNIYALNEREKIIGHLNFFNDSSKIYPFWMYHFNFAIVVSKELIIDECEYVNVTLENSGFSNGVHNFLTKKISSNYKVFISTKGYIDSIIYLTKRYNCES